MNQVLVRYLIYPCQGVGRKEGKIKVAMDRIAD